MISPRAGSPSASNEHASFPAATPPAPPLPQLILASASPRRLALLAQIGLTPDQIAPQNLDETPSRDELPRLHAQRLAYEKARAAATAGAFVLAADTVVAVGRRILGKAETAAEAEVCLSLLSGRRHHVYTAVSLISPNGAHSARLSNSIVTFARLTEGQKQAYLATGEWHGKAGGYAIQGFAESFVRALSGSFSGVVGLPLFETTQLLRGGGFLRP